MTASTPSMSKPLIAFSTAARLMSWPPVAGLSTARRSRSGSMAGITIALWAVRIILGVALLAVAGVLMVVVRWSGRG